MMGRISASIFSVSLFLAFVMVSSKEAELKQALVRFMANLSPPNSATNDLNFHCKDQWRGVTCNSRLVVRKIVLDKFNMTGVLDAASLCNVTSILVLSLGNNNLSGGIPSEISNCRGLTHLYLGGNRFSGSLPPSLSQLGNLKRIDISDNDLSGNLPNMSVISGLLTFLAQDNQLTGAIPNFNFSNLVQFNVSNNNFSGSIPGNFEGRFGLDSFSGNPLLCGDPLPNLCPSSPPPPPPPPPPLDKKSKKTSKTDKLIHAGYGVLGLVSVLPDHHPEKPEKTLNNGTSASGGAHNLESVDGVVAMAVPSMDAVVKVFCTHTEPDFSLPWQRKRQYSSSSSGFVIGGRRVLTNAHSVEHYTQVKLKKRGSDTKYVATVLAIGTECDIALLTVESDEFWEGVSPVQFGELPALQDAVTVVGYPIGGDTISVTSGVVSRIEILSYVHGSTELLGLQIDAAINSGNSGGPAFNDKGNCVGIAFQSLKHEDAENIGYVIPTPVIMHFIQDYEKNGAYTGFPLLGVEWQKMENPDMRMAMGMKPAQKGVRIKRIDPTAPESEVLKPSDIILSFDGVNIANDGTVPFRHGERIGFSYLVSQKYTGDVAAIKVLRSSETLRFHVKLKSHERLIPAHNKCRPPSYYIVAGLVFTTVSVPYLRSEYGEEYEYEAPVKLLDKLLHEMPQSPDEQLVVISQVLVADINIGYEEIVNTQVLAFNGKPVKNLRSLASMVESCDDEFLKFDLEYQQIVVLRTKAAKAATLDILTTHSIPSATSDDLKS